MITVPDPTDQYGYDLSCTDDCSPEMREVSGTDLLKEAVFRRLTTPRGSVIDAPDYGFDLRSLLSKGQTPAQLAAIPGLITSEILKDDRFEGADVTVTESSITTLTLSIVVYPKQVGPFSLVVSVSDAAVQLG